MYGQPLPPLRDCGDCYSVSDISHLYNIDVVQTLKGIACCVMGGKQILLDRNNYIIHAHIKIITWMNP